MPCSWQANLPDWRSLTDLCVGEGMLTPSQLAGVGDRDKVVSFIAVTTTGCLSA